MNEDPEVLHTFVEAAVAVRITEVTPRHPGTRRFVAHAFIRGQEGVLTVCADIDPRGLTAAGAEGIAVTESASRLFFLVLQKCYAPQG